MTSTDNVSTLPAEGVALQEVSKTFPGMRALQNVTFDIARGTFHALVGGNGSGKSTLIKILAGAYRGDPGGQIVVDGQTVGANEITPEWSDAAGLRFVHQDLGLFSQLSVGENLCGAHNYPGSRVNIPWRELHRRADATLERFDIPVRSRTPLSEVGPANRTLIAIARCLRSAPSHGKGLLVLDEPTARLPVADVDHLLRRLRDYVAAGYGILYVSHRLDEILDCSQVTTVLRDGKHIVTTPTSALDRATLTGAIVGGEDRLLHRTRPVRVDGGRDLPMALTVRGLRGGPLQGIDLDVAPGEVVAIAGLAGSGRTSLLENIFGVQGAQAGTIEVGGRRLRTGNVASSIKAGIALVPEDRAAHALFPDLPLSTNLSAADPRRYRRRGWWQARRELEDRDADIRTYAVRAPDHDPPIRLLSGGNQQKVVIARWMRRSPAVLLLDEPTQGVDVGARADIYQHIDRAVAAGTGVLMVSSDLDELLQLADRVLVLRRGTLTASLSGAALTRTNVSTAMFNPERKIA
ncbi:sugar ABC transporter ATP-binding protein [Actinomadura madurae]|uniref:sugar ABC transporter ATP-binding protein n=1 Tax=Actinomadura madurae TaxID=1993 RepID=UPI000D87DC19|nr:sugar ABC transporter ATP-binding protein [Actinomadura madurae]SPT51266.1 Galactose/methyl galactoside import ATP-binding protein MglA [Actinomadura madurae]